ncbi:Trehalose utilization [Calycomorphotria hydatis]|uniref:Trehalose utilization n=2 Tax=Calycomorphotria hydatis TaxID=2528027 RepID=A0A517T969_9PLAN|nr:Trehalose utilization [Calycomorphotria hydatis]
MIFSRSLVACLAMLCCTVIASAADLPRVLFLTQSKGYTHGSVRRGDDLSPAEIAIKQLAQQSGAFEVDCTQDAALDITKENLQNYDIVMLYTTGNLPIKQDDLEYFLNDWLKQPGHGVIGFHSATDTFKDYEPYWNMIGGTFNGHPWNAGTTVSIKVHDSDFPAMKPFGEEFTWKDEIYQYRNWQPENVRVLMSLDMVSNKIKKPYQVPVAWCRDFGKGKIFYNNLGHNEATWTKKPFLDSTVAAVKWITGEVSADATPNPEVSAKEEQLAKEAVGE